MTWWSLDSKKANSGMIRPVPRGCASIDSSGPQRTGLPRRRALSGSKFLFEVAALAVYGHSRNVLHSISRWKRDGQMWLLTVFMVLISLTWTAYVGKFSSPPVDAVIYLWPRVGTIRPEADLRLTCRNIALAGLRSSVSLSTRCHQDERYEVVSQTNTSRQTQREGDADCDLEETQVIQRHPFLHSYA